MTHIFGSGPAFTAMLVDPTSGHPYKGAGGASAPVNTVAPAITGSVAVGSVLTCSTGTWTGTPTGYTYQWYWADTSAAISGATSSTYTTVNADILHTIDCVVVATNASGSASATSNATAAISFNPSSISGLLLAFDPNDSTLVTDSNGIFSMAGAYGTAVNALGGPSGGTNTHEPDLTAAISTRGEAMIKYTAANSEYFTFVSQSLVGSDCEVFTVFGMPPTTTGTRCLIGRQVGPSSAIQLASFGGTETSVGFLVRVVSGASTAVNADIGALNRGCNVASFGYAQAAGTVLLAFNGVENASAVSVGTGSFIFDCLGQNNATNFMDGYRGTTLVYSRKLTTAERATVNAWLCARYQSKAYYFASAGSDTANTGWSTTSPWAGFARMVSNLHGFYAGDTLRGKGGDTFREGANAGKTIPAGVTLELDNPGGTFGTGRTIVLCSTLPSNWTLLAGYWSRAETKQPYYYIYDTAAADLDATQDWPAWLAYPTGQAVSPDTNTPLTPAAGKFGWVAGTMYWNDAAGNPNNRLEVPVRTVSSGGQFAAVFTLNANNSVLSGGTFKYCDGTWVSQTATVACKVIPGDWRYCTSDALDCAGNIAGRVYTQVGTPTSMIAYNGSAPTIGGSDGDGVSAHGTAGTPSTVNRSLLRIAMNFKASLDDQTSVISNNDRCLFVGSNPVTQAENGAGGPETLTNSKVIAIAGSLAPYGFYGRSASANLVIEGNTFILAGGPDANSVGGWLDTAGATATVKDNIFIGFRTGLKGAASTVWTNDYNCIHVDSGSAQYSGVPTAGAHEITIDPLLNNQATGDLTLQSGSPCLGTGIAIGGLTKNFAGATRANPPNMGAL